MLLKQYPPHTVSFSKKALTATTHSYCGIKMEPIEMYIIVLFIQSKPRG
jgi:hypothetical protein